MKLSRHPNPGCDCPGKRGLFSDGASMGFCSSSHSIHSILYGVKSAFSSSIISASRYLRFSESKILKDCPFGWLKSNAMYGLMNPIFLRCSTIPHASIAHSIAYSVYVSKSFVFFVRFSKRSSDRSKLSAMVLEFMVASLSVPERFFIFLSSLSLSEGIGLLKFPVR